MENDNYIATRISELLEEKIDGEEEQTPQLTDNEEVNDTALESPEQQNEAAIQEGANSEYTGFLKELCASYKDNLKEARKKFNAKDYKEAKKLYAKAESDAKNIEKKIKAVKDDNVWTAILGYFINYGVSLAGAIVVLATAYVPVIGTVAAVGSILESANQYKAWFESLKTEGPNASSLNFYKQKVLGFCKNLADAAVLGQKACDAKMKAK